MMHTLQYPALSTEEPLKPTIGSLAIAITFFYSEQRLPFLKETVSRLACLANKAHITIITNTKINAEKDLMVQAMGLTSDYSIKNPELLGHPYLLPWCHYSVFKEVLATDSTVSHFLYLEDDIGLHSDNISYWLEGRERLRPLNLVPAFLRYEIRPNDDRRYATDVTKKIRWSNLPKIKSSSRYMYINLPFEYQGMYLLDRELLTEYLESDRFNPDAGHWGIRETAAQGITFVNVPAGFRSRTVIGYDLEKNEIDQNCLIHHLPNNYANDHNSICGKIEINNIFRMRHVFKMFA